MSLKDDVAFLKRELIRVESRVESRLSDYLKRILNIREEVNASLDLFKRFNENRLDRIEKSIKENHGDKCQSCGNIKPDMCLEPKLNCPFCGNLASDELERHCVGITFWRVWCIGCGTRGSRGDTKYEAIENWNMRAG
jgi:Lar family restriction alleviation protein